MKKIVWVLVSIALVGIVALPVWAGSPRPSADALRDSYYAKRAEAAPQATYNYMVDFVSNAYNMGFGSIFCITNYDSMVRNHIVGYVVPLGADPGQELIIDLWLNPYEVRYISLDKIGLGDTHGWAMLWSTIGDFGCGVLLYNSSTLNGMTWIRPWYWTTN
jgi:hypothetical protein